MRCAGVQWGCTGAGASAGALAGRWACARARGRPDAHARRARALAARAKGGEEQEKEVENQPAAGSSVDEATEKYGLEYGLFKTLTSENKEGKKSSAKNLLTKYGSAYLLTSISFAIVSFTLCYFLVSAGVDVAALLNKLGLRVNVTSERVGTIAIAYAAHKAASPIRFPPTVALTPVVAKWMGKKMENGDSGEESS